jgi:hypothetical protein
VAKLEDLEEKIAALEKRLTASEDADAIQLLKAEYAEITDSRYRVLEDEAALSLIADQIAALFSEDAVWDGGAALGCCEGREAIAERFRKPTLQFAQHFFVKPRIHVDGEKAKGRWDILAPCTSLDGKCYWMAGVEDDEYVKKDGVWLHSRMKLELIFMAPYERGWAKRKASNKG